MSSEKNNTKMETTMAQKKPTPIFSSNDPFTGV
jgi:hypothetical protein